MKRTESSDKDLSMVAENTAFIVKVKLLSSEVYEFQTTPDVRV